MAQKWIYYFGEGGKGDKMMLGGKGANLSEMTRMGLPIPSGFVISTGACMAYQVQSTFPADLESQIDRNMARLEQVSGKKFGDSQQPLLVSVRSGAAVSMPGMMDTVLNLGLSPAIVEGMARRSGNARWAYDSYRRFIQMYSDVVMDIKREEFEHYLEAAKKRKGVKSDTELTTADLKQLIKEYFALYKRKSGEEFPTDPRSQLISSIKAVFDSWNNPRAVVYRKLNKLPDSMGTAVNVQEMVYGNMGETSATGVAFTRNPSTGLNKRFGEYLINAQGEDVVAGIRTPLHMEDMKKDFPKCAAQLYQIFDQLESHYKDMQDIEFTIEQGKLYILQTRNGKRTANASLRMAVDMANEGLISVREAVLRVSPNQINSLLHSELDPAGLKGRTVVGRGLPASPGAAVGTIVFTAEAAVAAKADGRKVVLVRLETSPEDISGMDAAEGILTARGGMTSHAAVVARGMNVCCVAGCSALQLDEAAGSMTLGGQTFREGDYISLDGTQGRVYAGQVPVRVPEISKNFKTLLDWADEFATMKVYANADTPRDAKVALDFGAQGIGLVRTEHMFFNPERILAVREMILASTLQAREAALAKLLPFQRADFEGILAAMDNRPVVIRLIDPPLHEFLPQEEKEQQDLARSLGLSYEEVRSKITSMHEFNPMLGFRGCRLGVVYPEINRMQVTAIFEAALALHAKGMHPHPHIEVPLVGNLKEYKPIKTMIQQVAESTGAQGKISYQIGTMIEVPRAALTADELAVECEFMSFGTNDLTQMTCGFSRDDSGVFLKPYVEKGLYRDDPFASIDQAGVGKLMQLCVSLARSTNPGIDFGICGEHGGEPASVEFCHRTRLNNVSCSPYRVPVARLAAGQAAIKFGTSPAPQNVFLRAHL